MGKLLISNSEKNQNQGLRRNTGILFALLAAFIAFAFWAVLPSEQVHAKQPKADPNAVLPVEKLKIKTSNGIFNFTVEIADQAHERAKGLMHRETMLPTHSMLFKFGKKETILMWMKNTPLSLDMVFLRKDGSVSSIARNTVPFSEKIIASREPVSFVLELNAGIAAQIGLKANDKISHRFFE